MSVVPNELTDAVWTQWQGHVINDVYRLGRFLGCSDHSGVFLTNSAALGASDVAIKLIPADRDLVESPLPRWARAAGLDHPHLLKLLQWGECQLDGQPHRYLVMEYADQTLSQLLQRRPLTDEEAREMLPPILGALVFLHGQNLVQGHLTPENILVVEDQLKLASDTIRQVDESTTSANALTAYSSQSRRASNTFAGDIRALGACLLEALARRSLAGWGEGSKVELPDDFSPVFREVVERCLHPGQQNRLSVTELMAWAQGQGASPLPVVTVAPAAIMPRLVTAPSIPEASRPTPSQGPRVLLIAVLAAIVILSLRWAGVRMVESHRAAAQSLVAQGSTLQTPNASAPMLMEDSAASGGSDPLRITVLHEVIPEVSRSARQNIRGHIEVSVRVIVDPDGSVIAATADRIVRSRYFPRVATQAARKWTFVPSATQSRRMAQIQFDFSRDETTAQVVP